VNCANCGKEIGPGKNSSREPEACGDRECQREVQRMYAEWEADVRERAESDNYDRYR
jgi:hypothetical protein